MKTKKITKRAQVRYIREMLSVDPSWAIKGLLAIFDNQTQYEQEKGTVNQYNRRGFTRPDAKPLGMIAKAYIAGTITNTEVNVLLTAMPKYAWQLRHRTPFDEAALLEEMHRNLGI